MHKFVTLAISLKQTSLPAIYDEVVFQIALNFYLHLPEEIPALIPTLNGFYTSKYEKHCMKKYLTGNFRLSFDINEVINDEIEELCNFSVTKFIFHIDFLIFLKS